MTRSALLAFLADRITGIRRSHPVRVAFDGPDTAGKTTLADELAAVLRAAQSDRPVIRAGIDGFHRPAAERAPSPDAYFETAFDIAAVCATLLVPLAEGREHRTAVFDYRTDRPVISPAGTASPDAILLFDGVFLLHRELRAHWDLRVYLHVPEEEILRRATVRDAGLFGSAEAVRQRYLTRYLPAQRIYLHRERPREHADVVIDNTDPAAPEITLR